MEEHSQIYSRNDNTEVVAQFMLMEFQQLNERARHNEQLAENRTNYNLAVVTATFTVLAFMYSSIELRDIFYALAPMLTFALSAIGIFNLFQVVDFHEDATVFYRRAGRIRKWFSEIDPLVLPYLPFSPTDDQPVFIKGEGSFRRVEGTLIVLVVISTLAWVTSMGITLIGDPVQRSKLFGIIAWFSIFATAFYITLKGYARMFAQQLRAKELKEADLGQVHFRLVPSATQALAVQEESNLTERNHTRSNQKMPKAVAQEASGKM